MLNILIVIILFVLLRVVLFKNIRRRRANVFNENQDLIVDIKDEDLIIDLEQETELFDADEDSR